MAHDVFISHSSKDLQVAEIVCQHLEAHGIGCWIAPRNILPGQNYAGEIVDGITSAKVFLLIFSSHANASSQVERELERAAAKHLPILPFRIENVQPTEEFEYWISSPHWLNAFSPPLQQYLPKLTASIYQIMGREAPAIQRVEAVPPPPAGIMSDIGAVVGRDPTPFGQKVVIASGAAVIALAGVVVAAKYLGPKLSLQEAGISGSIAPAPAPPVVPPVDKALLEAQSQLAKSEEKIERWEANSTGIVRAEQIEPKLEQLREDRRDVALLRERSELRDRAARLLNRYDTAIADSESKLADAQLQQGLSELDAAVGDPARFAATLIQLSQSFPKARVARELESVANESPYWSGVEDWNQFLSRESFTDRALAPAAAAKLISDAEKLKPISPFVEYFLLKEPHLSAISGRVDFNNIPITGGLRQFLSDRWMNDLYVVELHDGTRYYLDQDPETLVSRSTGDVKIEYIVNARRETKYVWESPKKITYKGRAPHCELSSELLQSLDAPQFLTTEWLPTFCRMFKRIVDDVESDPVARALILDQTLQMAALGSYEIRQAFQKHTQLLSQRGIDASVAWFNPTDTRAAGERKKAEELFRTLPPIEPATLEANSLAEKWRQTAPPKFLWIGWLRQNSRDQWTLSGAESGSGTQTSYVVAKLPGETLPTLEEVGEIEAGGARFRSGPELLRNARPVFVEANAL